MSVRSFLELTPNEFYLALKSKNDYDGLLIETEVKFVCETIRQQTLHQVNIHLQRKDRYKDPTKLFGFSWDKETKKRGKEPQTKEEMLAVMKLLAGTHKKKK